MTPDDLRELVREALDNSLQIANISNPTEEEPGELYVAAVDGEDFVIRFEPL